MGSIHGTQLEGILVSVPHLPNELLEDQNSGIRAIQDGVAICHAYGAKIAGLGAVAAMIGGQGKQLAKESPIPITTGNSLTTYTALKTAELVLEHDHGGRQITLIGTHLDRLRTDS